MATKAELVERIRNEMQEIYGEFTVLHKDHDRELLVVRVPHRSDGGFDYHASTHWGHDGALSLRRRNPDDVPDPRWTSGGIARDASPQDVAEVMHRVWADALDVIRAAAKPSAKDRTERAPRP